MATTAIREVDAQTLVEHTPAPVGPGLGGVGRLRLVLVELGDEVLVAREDDEGRDHRAEQHHPRDGGEQGDAAVVPGVNGEPSHEPTHHGFLLQGTLRGRATDVRVLVRVSPPTVARPVRVITTREIRSRSAAVRLAQVAELARGRRQLRVRSPQRVVHPREVLEHGDSTRVRDDVTGQVVGTRRGPDPHRSPVDPPRGAARLPERGAGRRRPVEEDVLLPLLDGPVTIEVGVDANAVPASLAECGEGRIVGRRHRPRACSSG